MCALRCEGGRPRARPWRSVAAVVRCHGRRAAGGAGANRADRNAAAGVRCRSLRRLLDQVIARQRELGARYAAARGARARAAIRDEARRFIVETLVSQVFPAWMGMPSAGGPQATASLPHQPGMYISCSYFLTAALQNAGLVLESRARFAQAPAAWIEKALLPPGGQIHRYGNLSPEELERRLVELGDGLYVVGLNIHVGFIVVRDRHARFVHSSYTPPGTVVDEPVVSSVAIALSRSQGLLDQPAVPGRPHRRDVAAPPAGPRAAAVEGRLVGNRSSDRRGLPSSPRRGARGSEAASARLRRGSRRARDPGVHQARTAEVSGRRVRVLRARARRWPWRRARRSMRRASPGGSWS